MRGSRSSRSKAADVAALGRVEEVRRVRGLDGRVMLTRLEVFDASDDLALQGATREPFSLSARHRRGIDGEFVGASHVLVDPRLLPGRGSQSQSPHGLPQPSS